MTEFTLTEQQKMFFETFGYLVFPGLMSDRIAEITAGFEYVFKKNGGNYNGREHDFKKTSTIVSFIGQSEALTSLLDDHRVQEITSSLLGDDYNFLTSAGNRYVGDTGWHADTPLDPPWPGHLKSINLSFYLDPVSHTTGALRVIPGSHFVGDHFTDRLTEGFQGEAYKELWGMESNELPSITLEVRPGDLLVFNNYMKHAAFGGGNNRRVILLNFSKRYPEERLEDLKKYVSTFAKYWVTDLHGEYMVRTADEERMRHLQQIQEHQDHLPELSRKAREEYERKEAEQE